MAPILDGQADQVSASRMPGGSSEPPGGFETGASGTWGVRCIGAELIARLEKKTVP